MPKIKLGRASKTAKAGIKSVEKQNRDITMLAPVWRFASAPFRLIPWYIWLALVAIAAWFGRNILLIIATIIAFHPIPVPPLFQGEPETLAEAQLQDLQHFRHVRRNERSLDAESRADFEAAIVALEARAGSLNAAEFQLELARLQARIDNGHSNASAARMVEPFDRVPFRTSWMVDELRVLRVQPGYEAWLGARLTHIGGVAVDDVLADFRDAFGGIDPFYFTFAPLLLEAPDYLAAIGIADPVYRLELMTGEIVEERIDPIAPIEGAARVFSGDLLMPWVSEGESWIAFEPAGDALLLRNPEHGYWFERLDASTAYIAIRSNFDDESGEALADWVLRARDEIDAMGVETLIVDQRFNSGGDLTRTAPLMRALGDIVGADGEIFMLANGNTFSAGVVNLAMVKEAAPTQTRIVGAPIGDRLQFWAEGWWYSLPNSGFRARYSTGFFDLQNGCEGIFICPWGSLHVFPVIVDDLDVDIPAGLTFEAYAQGRDPALEAIGIE